MTDTEGIESVIRAVADEDAAERAYLARQLQHQGFTYAKIADEFNQRGIPGNWTRSSVEALLRDTPVDAVNAIETRATEERDAVARKQARVKRLTETIPGLALLAYERGDHVFQACYLLRQTDTHAIPMTAVFTTVVAGDATEEINEVCRAGWEIVSASMVFEETGGESRDKFFASGQHVAVKGRVFGYYVFRRNEANRSAVE